MIKEWVDEKNGWWIWLYGKSEGDACCICKVYGADNGDETQGIAEAVA